MPIRLLPIALIAATPLVAQTTPREAAKTFTLDSIAPPSPPAADPAPPAVPPPVDVTPPSPPATDTPPPATPPTLPAPVLPESAAVSASPPAVPASDAPPAVRAVFTLDTPIQDLIANADAKAVLDRDLPGVSDDENLDKFKALSLRSFQPMTGGQMTDAMLAKIAADLDVLAGGTGAVAAPVKIGNAKRSKDDSR